MKNTVFEFLQSLGLDIRFIINGLIGSIVWALYRREKFLTALRQIVIGSTVSAYLTPVLIAKSGLDLAFQGAASFTLGLLGLVILEELLLFVKGKFKKWKDIRNAIKFINKKDE